MHPSNRERRIRPTGALLLAASVAYAAMFLPFHPSAFGVGKLPPSIEYDGPDLTRIPGAVQIATITP